MIRRCLCALLCLLLLPAAARAIPAPRHVEGEPLALPVEVLDSPYPADEFFALTPLALRITAPGGQALHLASPFLRPEVYALDVNFDGRDDLAVMVDPGGTNVIYRLFIWQDGRYMAVDDGDEKGLYNLELYPRQRLLASHAVSGEAGALHEVRLLRWEGNRLVPVRSAVCGYKEQGSGQDGVFTQVTWHDVLHARVYDHSEGLFSGRLIWEESHDMAARGMAEAYDAFSRREQEALWQGLEGE